jgi:4-diphosphocytidyl-2-C-methyl-D-erythritol kinase
MVPISLYDEIEITTVKEDQTKGAFSEKLKVTCDHPLVPKGRRNLVYRAASLLLRKSAIKTRVRIHIFKRIPVGGGLGGGSSDAAATMVALNRLLGLNFSSEELQRFSLALGADVPFFINGRPARARGIGERLTPLGKMPPLWLVILYPGFAVSTAWVYEKFSLKLTKPTANTSITSLLQTADGLRKLLVNDLEVVTMGRYPELGLLKSKLLQEGAIGALMSGTGSSVFGLFNSRQRAERAFRRLGNMDGPQTFLVRVLIKQVDTRAR